MAEGVLVLFLRKSLILEEVLLAKRYATARIGPGKWNGYGGEIEAGETSKQATLREVNEESDNGLIVLEEDLEYRGRITFYNKLEDDPIWKVDLFVCKKFSGKPKETKVMLKPTWFRISEIDALDMLPGDKLFMPAILAGKMIPDGWIVFSNDMSEVITYSLETIEI